MGIMAIGQIIVLSALVVQTFSAPSGCIESCNFYQTSYQSRHTSDGSQDHQAGLVEGNTHLNDHDYAKPGNWTEHNQYNTDSGHGKVHEERGQYVEGSKRVRYYKKNFTSSYGNVNELGTADFGGERSASGQRRYDSLQIPSNQHFESQVHDQLGQTVAEESGYNRLHSQQTQSLSTRIDSKSERLEDFGDYSGHSQVNQHIPTTDRRYRVETVPGNWSRVDSYKTDNGHGRVFEEEGQYETGPKKVRYYKKNYTSSYSTSAGVPQHNIDSPTLDKLHGELHRNLHEQLDNFRREFHEASSAGHVASAARVGSTADLIRETVGFHDLQTAESDNYGQQLDYRRATIPSSGITHHHIDHQERETHVDTRQPSSHVYPSGGNIAGYGTESQGMYHNRESHVSRVHPVSHSSHSVPSFPSYTQAPVIGGDYQTSSRNVHTSERRIDESQRTREISGGHRTSNVAQNQLAENSHRAYNPSTGYSTYPGRRDETRHYEEHWSSSSHTGGNVAPSFTHGHPGNRAAGTAHYDRDAYDEQRGRYHGYDSHAHTSDNNYNPARRTSSSGQLVTGSVDLGQAARGVDCTEETQQYRQETRYHRKYKRDDHHVRQHRDHHRRMTDDEDSMRQDQERSQHIVDDRQLEDSMQQAEQLTEGRLEFGQQTDQHLKDSTQQQQTQKPDDFAQQTSGELEFGQQTVGDQQQQQHLEHLTQRTEGRLEFGQQTVGDQQQQQHLQDLTQRTEGRLEFGQQTVGDEHLEDLTQQQSTQQTEGRLEFSHQTVGNQHRLEDSTQRDERLTQRTEDQLAFGQQTVGDQHLEDLTQQQSERLMQQTQESDDFAQQTNGKLESNQQTVGDWHSKDSTQQTQDFDSDFAQQTVGEQLEYEQQNDNVRQLGHLAQQFPRQREESAFRNDHFTQQNEQFTQQTSDDFAQRINGKLELGQRITQSINKYTEPKSQRLEEFNENDEDSTEQTTKVSNHFAQQAIVQPDIDRAQSHGSSKPQVGSLYMEDFAQQNQDSTQQVAQLNDFAQQTTGNLEYGQQREQQWKPRYTQHSESFSQQSHRYPFRNDNEQSEWRLGQVSQKTEFNQDFAQQTVNDQQSTTGVMKPAPKPKPRQRLQKHDSIPSHTDATTDFDLFNPIEVSSDSGIDDFHGQNVQDSRLTDFSSNYPRSRIIYAQGGSIFDNEKENMDRLHWVHKSNDATVGLQWHYDYHPSDLTNVKGSHDTYYPRHNVNSKPQPADNVQQQSTLHAQHNKYDQQLGSFQQSGSSYFNQDSQEAPSGVIPLQNNRNLQHTTAELGKESIQTEEAEEAEHKMESRILEAYGGGPYDASRNDDIYHRVRLNPSATLPPIIHGEDPWDIREKPRERITPWTVNTFSTAKPTLTEETTMQTVKETVTTEAAPSSFWNRLGHKITSTYDKAKEKAKEIFG